MGDPDLVQRSIEAGRDLGGRTQERLDAALRDLADAAEDQRRQVQQVLHEVLAQTRRTTEQLVETLDREIRAQLSAVGLSTKADLGRLEALLEAVLGLLGLADDDPDDDPDGDGDGAASEADLAGARRPAPKRSTDKKAPAKKPATKKKPATTTSTAEKSTAEKSTAEKSTAKKSTAKKSTAKKSTAKKSTAKKSTAKKSATKMQSAGEASAPSARPGRGDRTTGRGRDGRTDAR